MNVDSFLTSGKDGCVKEWSSDFLPVGQPIHISNLRNDLEGKKKIKFKWKWKYFYRFISFLVVSVCSVATRNGYCVAGTRDSEIYGFALNGTAMPTLLVQGHYDDELHALACHPRKNIFVTGGDDSLLRWTTSLHLFVKEKNQLNISLINS